MSDDLSRPIERVETPMGVNERSKLLNRISELEAEKSKWLNKATRVANENAELRSKVAILEAEVERLSVLLMRCYQSGHRQGWEPGESTDEVMCAVREELDNLGVEIEAEGDSDE